MTIQAKAAAETEVRKSRFIASLSPADNEEEALAFIREVKHRYGDARHNAYAYDITGAQVYGSRQDHGSFAAGASRFSDDGEPSGTAGYPILETLRLKGLSDVVAVVSRYFGGILLGAPGLARAYAGCAKEALDKAGEAEKVFCRKIELKADYRQWERINGIISGEDSYHAETIYGEIVTARFYIPIGAEVRFCGTVREAAGGQVEIGPNTGEYAVVASNRKIIRVIELQSN